VRVNGIVLNPSNGVYAITNIYGTQTITISNAMLNKYEIVAQAFAGGTITPAGVFAVNHGDNKTFEMTPDNNFQIKDVIVNGESMGAVGTYTFSDIRGNNTIKAYFEVLKNIDPNEEAIISIFSYRNTVIIMNEKLVPIQQVEIMDMYGRVVWTGEAVGEKTEITLNVAAGIYGVRIATGDGQYPTTKIIINH
jgi:hypothetical protein